MRRSATMQEQTVETLEQVIRERAVDIPVLANRFLARYCAANGLPLRRADA